MMKISTTRFGSVEIEPEDIFHFPSGLSGMDESRHWVLFADAANDCLGWLQNVNSPDIAFAVVSPRRFVPEYQVRVLRSEIFPLQLRSTHDAQVLVIVSKSGSTLTVNLRAPLLFNLERRLGRQVVVNDEQSLQHALTCQHAHLRKSA